MDEDEFIARDYQSELADIATRQNSILYLPTGSGKTFISILVIKRFLNELERWVFFYPTILFTALSGLKLAIPISCVPTGFNPSSRCENEPPLG